MSSTHPAKPLYPGRLIAGIGHGMPDWTRQAGARPASPLTLLKEYTTALRLLMCGEPGPTDGRYVRCEGVVLTETPDIVPPVILGVRGPKSQAAAGEVADGLLLAEPAGPACIASSPRHMGNASDAGGLEIVTYDAAAVDDDEDAALNRVREGLSAIGEPDWAAHIDPLPFATELRAHHAACADAQQSARTMPAAWIRELSIAGTPDRARAAINARHAAGATSVVLTPTGPDALAALDSLARALAPRH
ncbi:LLM class flavin-dependent oxidoreductase [Streptomyces sp. NPDC098085]|uniref:LLM class flavin-dependent oxidoreductase n=1 Tax=Streptomyces sp. NPDC098085 TaxID=3366094 RepID=UPI0037FD9125